MPVVLEHEDKVFTEHRSALLAQGEGKCALIKGDTVVDICASYEDACKEGRKRFGAVPFLIQDIQREDDVDVFYAHPLR